MGVDGGEMRREEEGKADRYSIEGGKTFHSFLKIL